MSRSAERVKGPGPRSVGDNDGDSPAPLATTATVRTFPHWPVTSITTRRDAQVRKPDGVYSLASVSAPGSVWSFLSLPQRAGLDLDLAKEVDVSATAIMERRSQHKD